MNRLLIGVVCVLIAGPAMGQIAGQVAKEERSRAEYERADAQYKLTKLIPVHPTSAPPTSRPAVSDCDAMLREAMTAADRGRQDELRAAETNLKSESQILRRMQSGRIDASDPAAVNTSAGEYHFGSIAAKQAAIKEQQTKVEALRQKIAAIQQDHSLLGRLPEFHVGTMGLWNAQVEIAQIIDAENMLVRQRETLYWVSGFSTAGMADGDKFRPDDVPIESNGTRQYQSALGAISTVVELRPIDWASHVRNQRAVNLP